MLNAECLTDILFVEPVDGVAGDGNIKLAQHHQMHLVGTVISFQFLFHDEDFNFSFDFRLRMFFFRNMHPGALINGPPFVIRLAADVVCGTNLIHSLSDLLN